jgi:hypothetical protein
VVFGRDVDWDIDPTPFNENVFGPIGASPLVIDSSYWGFENPAANVPYVFSCFAGCNSTDDLGAGIRIDLGLLGAGGTSSFNYYYGISTLREDVNGLIADTQAAGAKYIIAGQSSEGGSANSATLGVSGVPEPAAWAMMLTGFAGLGAALRRRRALAFA